MDALPVMIARFVMSRHAQAEESILARSTSKNEWWGRAERFASLTHSRFESQRERHPGFKRTSSALAQFRH
jgi:hypothetical protein